MKKIISAILAAAILSAGILPSFAEGEVSQSAEIESGYTVTYPQEADASLVNDVQDVVYENDEEDKPQYSDLAKVVYHMEEADARFIEYYNNNYTIAPEQLLVDYFSDNEITQLLENNSEYDCDIMLKLLVCLLNEADTSDTPFIVSELNGGVKIYSILKQYIEFILLDDNTKTEIENSFHTFYDYKTSDIQTYSYEDDFVDFMTENKYYTSQGNNVYIDDVSGNVQYMRTDLSIPVRNGLNMDVSIKYDLQDSDFANYTNFSNNTHTNPLGNGWIFNITHANKNIITLSDGRSVQIRNNSMITTYYKDIDYKYDSEEGKYYVAYRDGTKEYFKSTIGYDFQYIYKKVDKYGNTVYYETDSSDKEKILKISNNCSEREINISYYDDRTEVLAPDGDVIVYNKTAKTYNYGNILNRNYTATTYILQSVYTASSFYSDWHVWFEYEKYDFWEYESSDSDGYVEQGAKVYTGLVEVAEKPGGESCKMTYTTRYRKNFVYDFPAICTYTPNSNTDDVQKTYYYNQPQFGVMGDTEITYYNGKRKRIDPGDNQTTTTIAKLVNGDYKTVQTALEQFNHGYSHIPNYTETKIYNNNGNYIKTSYNYEYNDDNQVTSCIKKVDDVEVAKTTFTYHSNPYKSLNMTEWWDENDNVYKYSVNNVNSYGDSTAVTESELDNSRCVFYTYDENHNIIKEELKDSYGSVTYSSTAMEYSDTYDNAVVTKITNGAGNSTTYTYDDNLRVITQTDGLGNTSRLEYDNYGRITKEIHPDNTFVKIDYWNVDSSIDVTDENGYMRSYWYAYGQVEELTEGSNYEKTIQTVTFDNMSRPVSKTDAMGNTTSVEYDELDRQVKITHPAIGNNAAGVTKIKYYDVFLEGSNKYSMKMIISPENVITCEYYDTLGRLAKTAMVKNPSVLLNLSNLDTIAQMPSTVQLVVTSANTYDYWGRLIKTADGMGRTTSYTYDIFDNVTQTKVGDGTKIFPVNYEYDYAGNITKMTQGTHVTSYEYNLAGQLVKMTDPKGYTEQYVYDGAGNLDAQKDKNGVWTYYTYNSRNMPVLIEKGSKNKQFSYDAVGNVLTQINENDTIISEYNADSTLKKQTLENGKSISYTYNNAKQVSTVTDYFGNTSSYTYSGGYIYDVITPFGNLQYGYNKDGSVGETCHGQNAVMYTYDELGRVKYIIPNYGSMIGYAYDNSGNVIGKNDLGDCLVNYTYDNVNRLAAEERDDVDYTYTYSYDKYNNMLSSHTDVDTTFIYDENNRLSNMNITGDVKDGVTYDYAYRFSYDKNGNMVNKDCHTTASNALYVNISYGDFSYNEWGQLRFSTVDVVGTDIYYSTNYSYYPNDMRKSKGGLKRVGTEDTNYSLDYYYSGDTVINEEKNGVSFATNLIGASGIEGRCQNSLKGFFVKDAHGDVRNAYTSTGTLLADYTYTPWGDKKSINSWAWAENNPVRYNGQYYDEETGMYYLRARYYDPQTRRFISEDPIKDGVNWYAYCGNNPVNFTDPSGLIPNTASRDLYNNIMDLLITKTSYNYLSNTINNMRSNNEKIDEVFVDQEFENKRAYADAKRSSILSSTLIKSSSSLQKVFEDVLNDDSNNTPQQTSALICVVEYYINSQHNNELGLKMDVSYQKLKTVYDTSVHDNILYYTDDIYNINNARVQILKNNYFEGKIPSTNFGGRYEYNNKIMRKNSLPDSQEEVRLQ